MIEIIILALLTIGLLTSFYFLDRNNKVFSIRSRVLNDIEVLKSE